MMIMVVRMGGCINYIDYNKGDERAFLRMSNESCMSRSFVTPGAFCADTVLGISQNCKQIFSQHWDAY